MAISEIEAAKTVGETINTSAGVIEKIVKKGKTAYQKLDAESFDTYRKYLKRASEKYGVVRTILSQEPQKLYDFFVPNPLSNNGKKILVNNVQNVLNISNFILILGSGAVGKSTLMKHYFLNAIENDNGLIPIFVELRDINDFEGDFIQFIHYCIKRYDFYEETEVFRHAISRLDFLFIFDGFDEIISEKEDYVYKEIDLLCDKYPHNNYVVTSRECRDFTSWQRFTKLEPMAFDLKNAKKLIGKIPYDAEIKATFISRLSDDLYEKHQSFASNPLLLTMMLIVFGEYGNISNVMHKFYYEAFNALFKRHDKTKGIFERKIHSKLDEDDFKQVFAFFCFNGYINKEFEYSREELRDKLTKISNYHIKEKPFNIDDYIQDLIATVCVVYQEGLRYKFTHRSFQEYFTAVFINSRDDEMQKKIYISLFNNNRINTSESVFQMMFEMNKGRFNKNFTIPLIRRLFTDYFDCDDLRLGRLTIIYFEICLWFLGEIELSGYLNPVNIQNINQVLSNISIVYTLKENGVYLYELEYLLKTYYNFQHTKSKEKDDLKRKLYKMYVNGEVKPNEYGEINIKIETALQNAELKKLLLEEQQLTLDWLNMLLTKLEIELNKEVLSIDEILCKS